LIFVCIAILEALDRLQERFHLPTSVIKDIRKRLTKMIDRSIVRPVSLSTKENLQKVESLGEQVAESDVWGEIARPEEVKGVIMWLISMTKTLNAFMITTSLGLCRRVFVFIRNLPGVSLACTIFCRIYQMVEEVLSSFSKNGDNSLTRNTKNTMSLSKDHHVIQGHHHHHHDYSLGGIGIGDGGGAAAGSNSNSSIHAGYVTDPSCKFSFLFLSFLILN
jgi:hypothetical protein